MVEPGIDFHSRKVRRQFVGGNLVESVPLIEAMGGEKLLGTAKVNVSHAASP